MASELIVQTIQGPSSGANANKVLIPSGHELFASGHVVQVVHGSLAGNNRTSTSNAFFATGLYVDITPKYVNSKIILQASGSSWCPSGWVGFSIFKDGTNLITANNGLLTIAEGNMWKTLTGQCVDLSVGTTSTIRYEKYAVLGTGTPSPAYYDWNYSEDYITAVEIAQ